MTFQRLASIGDMKRLKQRLVEDEHLHELAQTKLWQTKLSSSLFPRKTRSYTTLVVHQILSLGNSGQSMWMMHLPSPGSQVQTLVNFTTPVLWRTYS